MAARKIFSLDQTWDFYNVNVVRYWFKFIAIKGSLHVSKTPHHPIAVECRIQMPWGDCKSSMTGHSRLNSKEYSRRDHVVCELGAKWFRTPILIQRR